MTKDTNYKMNLAFNKDKSDDRRKNGYISLKRKYFRYQKI